MPQQFDSPVVSPLDHFFADHIPGEWRGKEVLLLGLSRNERWKYEAPGESLSKVDDQRSFRPTLERQFTQGFKVLLLPEIRQQSNDGITSRSPEPMNREDVVDST